MSEEANELTLCAQVLVADELREMIGAIHEDVLSTANNAIRSRVNVIKMGHE